MAEKPAAIPENSSQDMNTVISDNLRSLRQSLHLSLSEVSERTGVSKSMLGQIERGLVNPTVSVLARIAGGLRVPIEQLVECREETPAQLHRAVDVVGARLCGGKVIRYPLFPFDTDSRCQSCQLDLFISGSYDAPDRVPGSRVYLTVLSGTLQVTAGGETYQLESRDSLSIPGGEGYHYENIGNNTVRMIERIYYRKV